MTETQIKQIADTLLPQFIPKNDADTELSFNFTVPPNNTYRVWYSKGRDGWTFLRFEKVAI